MTTAHDPTLDEVELEHRPIALPGMSVDAETAVTETVVLHHLRAFLDQKGVPAIVSDYDEDAHFYGEATVYHGKEEISGFFTGFLESLPVAAIERFTLRSLRVDRNIAYITWCVGSDIPLGTDTFVVHNGKIVSQTFAMYAPAQ